MSDLDGNPEDRISHVVAHILANDNQTILSSTANATPQVN